MTQRASGSQLRFIKRGDVITADHINAIASAADRQAREITGQDTQYPEGQDGDGAAVGSETYTETSRVTSTVRIEDENDDTIFVDIERMDSVTFQGTGGGILTLIFNNPPAP